MLGVSTYGALAVKSLGLWSARNANHRTGIHLGGLAREQASAP